MKSSRILAVAAVCAVAGLAGCGDDNDATPSPTPAVETATPKPPSPADQPDATPTEKWVRTTCDKLEAGMKALQPPNIKGTTPEDTKQSLVTFFTQLSDQLGNQEKILNEVGPPPGKNAKREFKDALKELARVHAKLERVVSRVEGAEATSKAEMDSLVDDLGSSLKVMSDYDGPIAQLAKTKALKDALSAEPGCGSFGLATQQATP